MCVPQSIFSKPHILKKATLLRSRMSKLTEEERAVLHALSELEPATLEELAVRTGLRPGRLKEILEELAKKGLLCSLDSGEFKSREHKSD